MANATSWMAFVDGENFTIRGQKFVAEKAIKIQSGPYWLEDTFLWMPEMAWQQQTSRTSFVSTAGLVLATAGTRTYYYTSVSGDDQKLVDVSESLWKLGFTPRVFKKDRKDQKSKGVDISLSTDMLSHAFAGHYDAAVLMAGDGDYVPLVEEVKRAGRIVVVAGFSNGMSDKLRRAADQFFDVESLFIQRWEQYLSKLKT